MSSAQCPICSLGISIQWIRKNGYQILTCSECKHHYALIKDDEINGTSPIELIASMTNNRISTAEEYFYHFVQAEEIGGHIHNVAQMILPLADKFQQKGMASWLDIGCGSGYLLKCLQERGWDAIGVEPGEWGQIAAQRRGLLVIKGLIDETTFNRTFDIVSAVDVLEHTTNPLRFLKLAYQYLNESGRLVVAIPFADSFNARLYGRYWSMVEPPNHCQYFTTRSLDKLLAVTGLEIEFSTRYNVQRPPFFRRFKLFNSAYDYLTNKIFGMDQLLLVLRKTDNEQRE